MSQMYSSVVKAITAAWSNIPVTDVDRALRVVAVEWNKMHTDLNKRTASRASPASNKRHDDDDQQPLISFSNQIQQRGRERFGPQFDVGRIYSNTGQSINPAPHVGRPDQETKPPIRPSDPETITTTVNANPEFYRIEEFVLGTVTNELVQNLATAEVRRPNAYAQIQVDAKRYRDMLQKENPQANDDTNGSFIVPSITVPQARHGINDILMGTAERGMSCVPCGKSMNACQGHYGRLDLILPQVSPSYMEPFRKVIRCICPHCYNLLFPVTPELEAELLNLEPSKRMKRCVELCKNIRYCGEFWDRKRTPITAHKKRVRRLKRRKLFALQFDVDQRERIEREALDNALPVKRTSNKNKNLEQIDEEEEELEDDDEDEELEEEEEMEEEEIEDDHERVERDDVDDEEEEEDDDQEPDNQDKEQEEGELDDKPADDDDELAPIEDDVETDATAHDDDDDEGEPLGDLEEDDDDMFDVDSEGRSKSRRKRPKPKKKPKKRRVPVVKKKKASLGVGKSRKTVVTLTKVVADTKSKPKAVKRAKPVTKSDDVTLEAVALELEHEKTEYEHDMNQFWTPNPYDSCSQLCKPYDPFEFEQVGCGGAVPDFTFSNLDVHSWWEVPWEGNVSKAEWPVCNNWTWYEMLRYVRPRAQILLGVDPTISPIRGYMIKNMPILPPSDRPSKNEGSKNSTPDDITGFLKNITQHRNRQLVSLWEEGVARLIQHPSHPVPVLSVDLSVLPSNHRHVVWVKRPKPGQSCDCGARSGKRCVCVFSGERVPCRCDDPLICRCILDSLPETSPLRHVDPYTLVTTCSSLNRVVSESGETAKPKSSSSSTSVTNAASQPKFRGQAVDGSRLFVPGKRRASAKGWSEHCSAVGNELIVYMSGEMKRRGEGSKKAAGTNNGKSTGANVTGSVSSWTSTNNAHGKIVRLQKSLFGRQIGKGGRFRGSLIGKRGNFTHRAVIGPCIELGLDEAGIPMSAKKILSFPERIERWNRADSIDAIRANEVNYLYHTDTEEAMHGLEYLNHATLMPTNGTIIERQLRNGAVGIENRQPTLHKPSMQGKKARFMAAYCTFLNLSNTTPYNADFDGDEMTFYLSRSHQSRAETLEIMMASKQFRSQQGASIVMGMVQNASLAAYLVTRKDQFFTRQQFMHLCAQFSHEDHGDLRGRFDRFMTDGLSTPALLFPEPLWTGAQLVSILLPEGFYYCPKGIPTTLDQLEQNVVIVGGRLLAGRLTKSHVGPGSNTIPHVILQDYGPRTTKNWIKGNQLVWNAYLEQWPVSMSRDDYLMREQSFRLAVLAALNETTMLPENHTYHLTAPNSTELFLRRIQARARELVTKKHENELDERNDLLKYGTSTKAGLSISDDGSIVTNHVRSLTLSGTKASMKHVGQLGAMLGQQEAEHAGRMVSFTSHYCKTRHLPEALAFVGSCFAQGLHPMSYFYHVKVGRYGMLQTTKTVPSVGYVQRRLGVILSGMHVAHDRTVRDSYGNIYQFGYGDDCLDPSMLEHGKFEFLTPIAEADPELAANQTAMFKIWASLHRDSEMDPYNVLLPVQFQRLLARVKHSCRNQNQQHLGKPPLVPLTRPEVNIIRGVWFDMLRQVHKVDFLKDNLMLRTLLQDLLSGWHISVKCGMSGFELSQLLTQLEHYITSAPAPPGESVGTIAAQSVGEPAMQIGLNQFKHADSKSKKLVGEAMAAFLQGTSQASDKLNECINATKREALGVMTVSFKPPYNASLEAASIAAQLLPCRRLLQLLVSATTYKPNEPLPDAFAHNLIRLSRHGLHHRENVTKSLDKFPITRLEFNRAECEKLELTLDEIEWYFHVLYKRGVYIWKWGQYDKTVPNYIVYVNLDIFKHPQLTRRIENFQNRRKDLGPINIVMVVQQVLIRGLYTIIVRGIPQVTGAYPVELSRYVYSPETPNKPIQRIEEWGAKTQGSNFEALARIRYVDFCPCTTTFVHNVNSFLGIEAARICQEETLYSLVRSVSGLDIRHIKIIADVMTAYTRGKVIPMTRSGMAEIDNNVFRLAAFEEIIKNLVNGAVHARKDTLRSVSASNMFGNRAPSGTGTVTVVPARTIKTGSATTASLGVSVSSKSPASASSSSASSELGLTHATPVDWRTNVRELCMYKQRTVPSEAKEWCFYQFFVSSLPTTVYGKLSDKPSPFPLDPVDPADEFCRTFANQISTKSLLCTTDTSLFPLGTESDAVKSKTTADVDVTLFNQIESDETAETLHPHKQLRPGPAYLAIFSGRPLVSPSPSPSTTKPGLASAHVRAPIRQFGWIENVAD